MVIKEDGGQQTSFRKAWEVLFPYLIYYLVFNAAYLIMAFACQAVMTNSEAARQFMLAYADTVSGVAEGLCRLLAVWPLFPMLKKELRLRGTETVTGTDKRVTKMVNTVFTVLLAVTASLGLNALFTLTGFAAGSQTYQEVAGRQYGVAFGIGLILYCVVSPLAEEVVFRGIIYNRLRRLFGPLMAVIASGLFFGVFHGNLVQGVYGACLGMLLAYVYERQGSFLWPVLFHAAANLAVYVTAHAAVVQEKLFTPAGCAVLLAVAVLCVAVREKNRL